MVKTQYHTQYHKRIDLSKLKCILSMHGLGTPDECLVMQLHLRKLPFPASSSHIQVKSEHKQARPNNPKHIHSTRISQTKMSL